MRTNTQRYADAQQACSAMRRALLYAYAVCHAVFHAARPFTRRPSDVCAEMALPRVLMRRESDTSFRRFTNRHAPATTFHPRSDRASETRSNGAAYETARQQAYLPSRWLCRGHGERHAGKSRWHARCAVLHIFFFFFFFFSITHPLKRASRARPGAQMRRKVCAPLLRVDFARCRSRKSRVPRGARRNHAELRQMSRRVMPKPRVLSRRVAMIDSRQPLSDNAFFAGGPPLSFCGTITITVTCDGAPFAHAGFLMPRPQPMRSPVAASTRDMPALPAHPRGARIPSCRDCRAPC